jgi:hypothetical protein
MSALRRTLRDMVNPTQMQRLAEEHVRDIRGAAPRRSLAAAARPTPPSLRIRLGQSLVSLGERVARDPLTARNGRRRDARDPRPAHSWL